jgi:hypothetical protein
MSEHHILLIHGTWCNGNNWGDFATEMERRGLAAADGIVSGSE